MMTYGIVEESRPSLNRNILECKFILVCKFPGLILCLNRNILECKLNRGDYVIGQDGGLNRNILECKCRTTSRDS